MHVHLHLVVPGDVDDAELPSGGNIYDRRVAGELVAAGAAVREHAVPGGWPRPGAGERARLAGVLDGLPDGSLVLLDGLVACGVPEVMAPRARRLRLAVLVHLPLADELGLAPAVAADLAARERATLRAVGAVVATSGWAARRLVARHALPAGRVHVARPGVDPAPLAPGTGGAGGLLCVGSVTATKGQDVLVEALAAVADRSWSCALVGPLGRDGEQVAAVRAAVSRHRLGRRVQLTGARTGDRLHQTYARADLLVLPSRAESYGMVVTEALARGIPVLASAVGGVPEALGRAPDGGRPGMLVAPGDAGALADALRGWLGDPGLRRTLRHRARLRRGMLVGWTQTARRLADVLCRAPGPPR